MLKTCLSIGCEGDRNDRVVCSGGMSVFHVHRPFTAISAFQQRTPWYKYAGSLMAESSSICLPGRCTQILEIRPSMRAEKRKRGNAHEGWLDLD